VTLLQPQYKSRQVETEHK